MADVRPQGIEVTDLIMFKFGDNISYAVVASIGPRANCRTVSQDALWGMFVRSEEEALRIFEQERPDLRSIDEKIIDLSYVSVGINGRDTITLVRKRVIENKQDRFDIILEEL